MTKKLVIIFFFCSFFSLYAVSIDELLLDAANNSKKMETIRINKINNDIQWEQEDSKETVSVTIDSGNVTFQKDRTGEHYFTMYPSLEVVLPDNKDDKDLELSFGVDNESKFYTVSGKNSETITPKANFSKTFSLDSYRDDRKDLTNDMNKMQQNLTYQTNLLEFNNSVIDDVISIINSKLNVKDGELSYNRLVEDYNSDLESGNLTAGTLAELSRQMQIESSKISLDNQKTKYEALLKSFKQNYGIDYCQIDNVRDCNLAFNVEESKNSELIIKDTALEIARENYEAEIGIAQKLKIGTSVNSPITLENNKKTSVRINGSTSASISGENYSFGTSVGAEYYVTDKEIYPYVTISGKWSNKSKKQSDDLEVKTLKNKVILAEIEYQNTVESYNKKVRDIEDEISNYKSEFAQFEIQEKYNRQILDRALQMNELGLVSSRDLQDARTEVEKDVQNRIVKALKGLKLENNIAILQF